MKKIFLFIAVLLGSGVMKAQEPTIVQDISSEPFLYGFGSFKVFNDQLLFIAQEDGYRYFCSLDTKDSITKIKEIDWKIQTYLRNTTGYKDEAYFTAQDLTTTPKLTLYAYNGTTKKIREVSNLGKSTIANFALLNGKMYFILNTSSGSNVLKPGIWSSDGTDTGTKLVVNIEGIKSVGGGHYGGKIYFQILRNDSLKGIEFWQSDGSAAGTHMIRFFNKSDIQYKYYDRITSIVEQNQKLYFIINRLPDIGGDFWVTDGTDTGTHLIQSTGGRGGVTTIMPYNGKFYLINYDSLKEQISIWHSDGTPGGTRILKDLHEYTGTPRNEQSVVYNNKLYFSSFTQTKKEMIQSIWVTDGTAPGTKDFQQSKFYLNDTVRFDNLKYFQTLRNKIFFYASAYYATTKTKKAGLWMTDGTDFECLTPDVDPAEQTAISERIIFNNTLYFTLNYNSKDFLKHQLYKLYYEPVEGIKVAPVGRLNFDVYPNPSDGKFNIILPHIVSGTLCVFNQLGKLQLSKSVQTTQKINMDLSDLSKGVYSIEIIDKTGVKGTKKIILN